MNNKIAIWVVLAAVVAAMVYLFIRQGKSSANASSTTTTPYHIKTEDELKQYLTINY